MHRFLIILFSTLVVTGCMNSGENQPESNIPYGEPHRLQLHFSPAESWMNDPNGMVYIDSTYHLFYQYYPDSTVWGPMHWGHAVSRDLLHWEHLPVALYPDSIGYIFSGSIVYDSMNSSGLGEADNPPLVAIYTYHDPIGEKDGSDRFQTQGIAYSIDRGFTWQKYSGNPVLLNPGIRDFRDPKVRWYANTNRWIMTLAVKDRIQFYSSSDLISWSFETEFGSEEGAHGGVWECPDLFPLHYEGEEYWILLVSINPGAPNGGSGTQYFIGDFDGKKFVPMDDRIRWLDYGSDNYAGVTWTNTIKPLFIGWMSNWEYAQVVPTHPWRSAMTIPRLLELKKDAEGQLLVASMPVNLSSIYSNLKVDSVNIIINQSTIVSFDEVNLSMISFDIEADGMEDIVMEFTNSANESVRLVVSPDNGAITFDRSDTGRTGFSDSFETTDSVKYAWMNKRHSFRFIKDNGSMEIFIDDGLLVMSELYFSEGPLDEFHISTSGEATIFDLEVQKLQSVWNQSAGLKE